MGERRRLGVYRDPSTFTVILATLLTAACLGSLARRWKGQIGLFGVLFVMWAALVVVDVVVDSLYSQFPRSIVSNVVASTGAAIILWIVSMPIARTPEDLPVWRLLLRGLLGAGIALVFAPIILVGCAV